MFLLKLIWNSSYDALYWWTVHTSSFSTWNQWTTIIKWLSCLWWNLMHATLCYLYVFWNHSPMIMCIISTIYIMFKCWFLYLALLKLYLRDPSLERKASFFLKCFFAVTCGIYLLQLGYILSDNKLVPLPGTEVKICSGKNDRVLKIKKIFLWANRNFC